jgi:D-3-phosphoglycerate dehydrogenase
VKSTKIIITDYPASMMPSHDYEKEILSRCLPGCEIEVYPYTGDKSAFLKAISGASGILTGFLPIGREEMNAAPALKCISLNATGYDNVDLSEASRRGIAVCAVGEYCTEDVAEHTIALMLALAKNLKHYAADIDVRGIWRYDSVQPPMRVGEMTLGIFGFGKIGRCTAKKALALGMTILACDPYIDSAAAAEYKTTLVSAEEIYERAHIIVNHTQLSESSAAMFCASAFKKMRQKPLFINVARGASVVEADLADALDGGHIRGAALDVLSGENPDLQNHPLAGRENVIITPHAAFYTTASLAALQEISCKNLGCCLRGEPEKAFKLVN